MMTTASRSPQEVFARNDQSSRAEDLEEIASDHSGGGTDTAAFSAGQIQVQTVYYAEQQG